MVRKITFCTYDAPLFHSVNTWLKRLLPELAKQNFLISLLVFFEGDLAKCETYNFFISRGYKVDIFPFRTVADKKVRWILETLAKDPPHIFVPNMLVHALFAGRWMKEAGIPTIGLIHSDDKFYDGLIDQFVNGEKKFQLSATVACSHYLYSKIENYAGRDIILKCIPYGVPTNNIPAGSQNPSTLRLIYTGRLVEEQKRISEVVKAMCLAANEIPEVEGVIFGSGDSEKVSNLIKRNSNNNKVRFGGALDNDGIFKELTSANIFVLLSDYEGLSQSLLEAMACGLVPVCTDMKSGIPELITNYKTGIIIKNRRTDFINAIKILKDNPELRNEISKNAKEKIFNHYSQEVCTNLWIDLLNELPIKLNPTLNIPSILNLPRRHRNFKYEDFRQESKLEKLKKIIRNTTIFKAIKKTILRRR